jgi:hypothetical protein
VPATDAANDVAPTRTVTMQPKIFEAEYQFILALRRIHNAAGAQRVLLEIELTNIDAQKKIGILTQHIIKPEAFTFS